MAVTAEPDPPDYRQDLVAHPESPAIMRRIVSAHVDLWGFRELADSVTLCAHELLAKRGPAHRVAALHDHAAPPAQRRSGHRHRHQHRPAGAERPRLGCRERAWARPDQRGRGARRHRHPADSKDVWAEILTSRPAVLA